VNRGPNPVERGYRPAGGQQRPNRPPQGKPNPSKRPPNRPPRNRDSGDEHSGSGDGV
jgi:hypothetical protein